MATFETGSGELNERDWRLFRPAHDTPEAGSDHDADSYHEGSLRRKVAKRAGGVVRKGDKLAGPWWGKRVTDEWGVALRGLPGVRKGEGDAWLLICS